eukprot:superscaffoldBa00001264_g9798
MLGVVLSKNTLKANRENHGLPSFVKSPEDQTGISGGVASFVCQAAGEPKPRITWMKKGKKVSSQRFEVIEFDDGSGSVLRIQPLRTHRDEAIYECTATNSAGEINTSAKLTVLEGALQIENSEESDQGKYECVAMNSAGTRYSAPANLYVRGTQTHCQRHRHHPFLDILEPQENDVLIFLCGRGECAGAHTPCLPRVAFGDPPLKEDSIYVGRITSVL